MPRVGIEFPRYNFGSLDKHVQLRNVVSFGHGDGQSQELLLPGNFIVARPIGRSIDLGTINIKELKEQYLVAGIVVCRFPAGCGVG